MMIMTSRRKDYERFLNKVSAKGYNIELIFLFLKNNAYRFRISESKINELRYHSKSFDEGQLIVYKDILDGKPVEL